MLESFMLDRQRTAAFDTLARSEPRGSAFLNRKDSGSEMYIS
jgi:hypothetical protein